MLLLLLITRKSKTFIKNQTNIDLNLLCNCVANKISLNSSKTEALLFHSNKNINYDFKLKIEGKRIFLTNSVKYSGIYVELLSEIIETTAKNGVVPVAISNVKLF